MHKPTACVLLLLLLLLFLLLLLLMSCRCCQIECDAISQRAFALLLSRSLLHSLSSVQSVAALCLSYWQHSRSHCVWLFQGQPKSRQCFCQHHCTSSLHNLKLEMLVLENLNKIENKIGKIHINTAECRKYLTQFWVEYFSKMLSLMPVKTL